jgi:uncharacterized protein (DUF1499 family)
MTTARRTIVMLLCLFSVSAGAGESPNNPEAVPKSLAACPSSPNCVSSQAADEAHRIAPLAFSDAPDEAFARLKRLLSRRHDTTLTAGNDRWLRVEFRTLLGFVDDGTFLLDRQQRLIQIRSASRLGWSDLGKNRRRLEEIRREFALPPEKP